MSNYSDQGRRVFGLQPGLARFTAYGCGFCLSLAVLRFSFVARGYQKILLSAHTGLCMSSLHVH